MRIGERRASWTERWECVALRSRPESRRAPPHPVKYRKHSPAPLRPDSRYLPPQKTTILPRSRATDPFRSTYSPSRPRIACRSEPGLLFKRVHVCNSSKPLGGPELVRTLVTFSRALCSAFPTDATNIHDGNVSVLNVRIADQPDRIRPSASNALGY